MLVQSCRVILDFLRKSFPTAKSRTTGRRQPRSSSIEPLESRVLLATVVSINRTLALATQSGTTLSYVVTFDQAVNGVDFTDFRPATTGSVVTGFPPTVTPIGGGPAAAYRVDIPNVHGNGDLRLDLIDNDTIVNNTAGPGPAVLGGAGVNNGSFQGETYHVLQDLPIVQSINRNSAQNLAAGTTTAAFTVTFSKPVNGVDPSDFQVVVSGTAVANANVTIAGASPNTTFVVTVSGINGTGTVGLNLVDDNSIKDMAGNPLASSTSASTFAAAQTVAIAGIQHPDVIAFADVNSDGFTDVITGNTSDNNVGVAMGTAAGTFGAITTFPITVSGGVNQGPTSLIVRDVNRDGQFDIITTNKLSNRIGVLLGNGNGTFQGDRSIDTTVDALTGPSAVAIDDINQDGSPELVVSFENSNFVKVYRGKGDGTFDSVVQTATGNQPSAVFLEDVDGDRIPDLIVAHQADNTITFFAGRRDYSFIGPQTFATGAGPDSIAVGDFNLDGLLDVATSNKGGNSVTVRLGTVLAAAVFGPATTIAVGTGPVSVSANDINGDGRLDLVVANSGTNNVSILRGDGTGGFALQTTVPTGNSPGNAAFTDFNRDGRLDLGTSSTTSPSFQTIQNSVLGSFVGQTYTVASVPPRGNAPVITSPATANVNENTPATTVVLDVNATDADIPPQTLSYTLGGTDAALFSINTATGEIRFRTSPDFETPGDVGTNNVYDLIVTVDDGNRGITTQNLAITVLPLNDNPPIINSLPAATVIETVPTTTVVLDVNATDADLPAQVLSYSLSGTDAGLFNINSASGAITFRTSPDFENPADVNRDNIYLLTVTVSDNQQLPLTATQQLTITVLDGNDAPTDILLSSSSVPQSQPAGTPVGNFSTVDPNLGDVFSYQLVPGAGSTDNGSFAVVGNQLRTATPLGAGGQGTYTIRVRSTDTGGSNIEKSFTITATTLNLNDPLITSSPTATITENSPLNTVILDVNATDADVPVQSIAFSLTGPDAAAFTIDPVTGEIRSKDNFDFEVPADVGGNNIYDVTVTATDNGFPVRSSSQSVTITVLPINDNSPVLPALTPVNVDEGTPATIVLIDVNGTDADRPAQTLTYSLSGADAALFNINSGTGEITFKATPDFEAPQDAGANNKYDVIVTVADNIAPILTALQPLSITVLNRNEAPTAADGTLSAPEEAETAGKLTGTDPERDALTFRILKQPAHGTVTLLNAATGDYRYKSDLNYNGPDSFQFQASDGKLDSSPATVSVTVTPVNDRPVAQDSTATVPENSPAGTPVATANITDIDPGDALQFAIVSGNTGGTFQIDPATGVIAVANNTLLDFEQPVSFDLFITAKDKAGESATCHVAITITNIDEPLVVHLPGTTTTYCINDDPVAIDPNAVAFDPDTTIEDFNEGTLRVTSESLGVPAQHDVLGVLTAGTGKGKISELFGNLVYESSLVIIGRIVAGRNGGPLEIKLTSFSQPDAVNALLRSLYFSNNSPTPELGLRKITIELSNSSGVERDIETTMVDVIDCGHTPVTDGGLSLPSGDVTYVNQSSPVAFDAAAILDTSKTPDFNGGRLTLTITSGTVNQNKLQVINGGGIKVSGRNVFFNGTKIGALTKKTNEWKFDFKSSAATPAAVQSLIRALAFSTTNKNKTFTDRVAQFVLTDGHNLTLSASKTVHVTP